jgi:hypothetical protein
MKNSINNFSFQIIGYGHYAVTYTSPKTGKSWKKTTSNMPLIDDTKNSDNPTQRSLNELKSLVKN